MNLTAQEIIQQINQLVAKRGDHVETNVKEIEYFGPTLGGEKPTITFIADMTRKDYKLIAGSLSYHKDMIPEDVFELLVSDLCHELMADNYMFDSEKFKKACNEIHDH